MYQYLDKPKHKTLGNEAVSLARTSHIPTSIIQKYPAFARGGQPVPVDNASITLGDNDTKWGHNAVLVETLKKHVGYTGDELKRECTVAHFVPEKGHTKNEKIGGIPGTVRLSSREEYYKSDGEYHEKEFIAAVPEEGQPPQEYFNTNYRKRADFLISLSMAQKAIDTAKADIGNTTYRLDGGLLHSDSYNCATWASKIMRAAGIAISSWLVFPHNVMSSARRKGNYYELEKQE